jgi:hypothetical protein
LQNFTAELAENNLTRHTEEELSKLKDLLQKGQEWFTQAKSKQDKLAADLDPVMKRADLQKRAKDLQAELDRLGKKKRPRKVYTPPAASSTSTPSEPTETSSSSASEETTTAHTRDEL